MNINTRNKNTANGIKSKEYTPELNLRLGFLRTLGYPVSKWCVIFYHEDPDVRNVTHQPGLREMNNNTTEYDQRELKLFGYPMFIRKKKPEKTHVHKNPSWLRFQLFSTCDTQYIYRWINKFTILDNEERAKKGNDRWTSMQKSRKSIRNQREYLAITSPTLHMDRLQTPRSKFGQKSLSKGVSLKNKSAIRMSCLWFSRYALLWLSMHKSKPI